MLHWRPSRQNSNYFSFDTAMQYLLEGGKVARDLWNKGTYITIDGTHVTICTPPRKGGYTFSSDDILARDWVFVLAEDIG